MSNENYNTPNWRPDETREEQNALSLADLWAMVWDHKVWYIICLAVALLVALFYLYRTPKTYSRSQKLIVEESYENKFAKEISGMTGGASSSTYGRSRVDNEMVALSSPDLMKKVVERLGLEFKYTSDMFLRKRELYTYTPLTVTMTGDNDLSSFSFVVSRKDTSFVLKDFRIRGEKLKSPAIKGAFGDTLSTPVGNLMLVRTPHFDRWDKNVIVSYATAMTRAKGYCSRLSVGLPSKTASVISMTLTDAHANKASLILSTLLDIYNEEWVNNLNRAARSTTDFINDRLVVIERELGGIETDLRDYKEANRISDIRSAANQYLGQSSEYSSQSFAVQNQLSIATYIKQYLNDPTHQHGLIPANSGIQNSNVESQISEYNKIYLQREQMVAASSESNPLVRDLDNSMEQLRSAINRSIDNLISTLQMQVNRINQQENDIMRRLASTSGQEYQLLSIERQQKVKEQLYVFLLQKREENELTSLLNVANTRLIQAPSGGNSPVAPRSSMILLVALVLGLGLPFLFFFLKNQLDTRVKDRGDVNKLQIPFLGEIPQAEIPAKWWQRIDKKHRYNDHNSKIVVKAGNRDMMNEAFRVMRTNLDLMTAGHPGCHKIMLTSFNPNAGKTYLIMNIAATMALKKSKVLLVDVDMRKATLSNVLSPKKSGIASYLNGKTDNIKEQIYPVADNLWILPVGNLPPNPAELLLSDRFTNLLDELSKEYDYLFLDCPPIDMVADTGIIAKHADITLFVMRAGLFDKRALPAAEELYESGKYNRMTLVLNGVETVRRGYGHYGYGHYGYGHYGYGHYGYGYGSYGYGNQTDEDPSGGSKEE